MIYHELLYQIEFNGIVLEPGFYVRSQVIHTYTQITSHSERVWLEDEKGIRFIKHRGFYPSEAEVNMKEFAWVKLGAKPL